MRIAWMDTRNQPPGTQPLWNVFERSSCNGGATWSSETQLSGPERGYDYILPEGFRFPFGDYFSIAIDNLGNTHVVWGEGRNYKSPGSIWSPRALVPSCCCGRPFLFNDQSASQVCRVYR